MIAPSSRYSAPPDSDDEEEGTSTRQEEELLDAHGTFLASWTDAASATATSTAAASSSSAAADSPPPPHPQQSLSPAAAATTTAAAARMALRPAPDAVPCSGDGGSAAEIAWRTRRAGDDEARRFAEQQRRRIDAEERARRERTAAALAADTARVAAELRCVLAVDDAAVAAALRTEAALLRDRAEAACKADAAAVAACRRRLREAIDAPSSASASAVRPRQKHSSSVEVALGRGPPVSQLLAAETAVAEERDGSSGRSASSAEAAAEFKTPKPLQRHNSGVSAATATSAAEAVRAAHTLVSSFTQAMHMPSVSAIAQKDHHQQQQQQQKVVKTAPFLAPTPPVPPSPFSLSPAESPVHTPMYTPVPSLPAPSAHRPQPQPLALLAESPAALRPVPEAPPVAPIPTPEVAPSPIDVQHSGPPSPEPSPSRPPPSPFVLHHGRAPTISGAKTLFPAPSPAWAPVKAADAPPPPPPPAAPSMAPVPSPFALSLPAEPSMRPQETPMATPSSSPFSLSRPEQMAPSLSARVQHQQQPPPSPAAQPPLVPGPQQTPGQLSAREERTGPSPQTSGPLPPQPKLLPAPTPPVPASPFGLNPGESQSLSGRVASTPASTPPSQQQQQQILPPTPSPDTTAALLSNSDGSEAAFREAAHSAEVLRLAGEAACGVDKESCAAYKKRMRLAVNQISADEHQVRRKVEELCNLLDEVRASPGLHRWCLRELARSIVAQGDDQVAQFQGSAFCIAAVAVGVAARFPDFSEMLVASFHEACIYTVPFHPRRQPAQTTDQYMAALGFRTETGGAMEPFELYAKRTAGIVSLYGAFMQTRMPSRPTLQHPRGLPHAWAWLARMLNMKPLGMGPTVILAMLETAGSDLHNYYGVQFVKLLRAVQRYLGAVKPSANTEASIARLRHFVDEALLKGAVPSHPEAKAFLR